VRDFHKITWVSENKFLLEGDECFLLCTHTV